MITLVSATVVLSSFPPMSIGDSACVGQQVQQTAVGEAAQDSQQKQKPKEKTPEERLRERLFDLLESGVIRETKRVLAAELLAELDELDDLFDLSDAELRKLQLAARGAASKAVDASRANTRATIERMLQRRFDDPTVDHRSVTFNGEPLAVEPPKEPTSEEDARQPAKDKLGIVLSRRPTGFYFTVRYKNGTSSTTIGPREPGVRSQEIWTKATKGILTKAQFSRYEAFRREKLQKAVVSMIMAGLIYELRLRDEQLAPVRATLEKTLDVAPASLSGMDSALRTYRMRLDPEQFADVLTEPQMDLFRSTQAYYRRYLVR